MTTPSNNHRPATLVAITAAGLLGALVAAAPGSAHTIPERDDYRAVAGRTVHDNAHQTNGHRTDDRRTDDRRIERACFIEPFDWDDSTDGPLPRCYTYLP